MGATASTPPQQRRPATGEDPSGSITVAVDEHGLVQEVTVRRLPEALRTAAAFSEAVDQALTRAHANAHPAAPPPPGQDVVRPRRVQRPAARPLRAVVEEALRQGHRPVPSGRRPLGEERGRSRNECVEVVLDRTGPSGTVTVDQGWLGQAAEKNVAAALTEAFAAAYAARTGR